MSDFSRRAARLPCGIRISLACAMVPLLGGGCPSLSDATSSLFVRGEPFVISGTAGVINNNGPCKVWYGDNGISYHLFQGARVLNEDFDRANVPGVRSRLEIATRNDLTLTCKVGTIVEVQRVLEVVD